MFPLHASPPLGGSVGASGAGPTGGWTWPNFAERGLWGAPGGWALVSPGFLQMHGISMLPLDASPPLGRSAGASGAGSPGGWTWQNLRGAGALGRPGGCTLGSPGCLRVQRLTMLPLHAFPPLGGS